LTEKIWYNKRNIIMDIIPDTYKIPGRVKYAMILVRCPKCKEAFYIRAEIKPRTMVEIIVPNLYQRCIKCFRKVKLQKVK